MWHIDQVHEAATSWDWIPPGSVIHDEREVLLASFPHDPARYEVHRTRPEAPAGGDLEDRARDLVREVEARVTELGGTALRWRVRPTTRPTTMDQVLLSQGYAVFRDVEVLAWDLGDGPEPRFPGLPASEGLQVELVEDEADLGTFVGLLHEVLNYPPPDPEVLADWRHTTFPGDRPRRHWQFVARAGGEAAATGGFTLDPPCARFWGAATRPPHRSRGAYRALVRARCREAHARGARIVLVKAREGTASPILQRAGFEVVAVETVLRRGLTSRD